MDKADPSRWQKHRLSCLYFSCLVALFVSCAEVRAISLSAAEATRIGKKIWQNECDGTVAGLTSWNAGEDFASLGIGHFIWYPAGKRGPFDESFPKYMAFVRNERVAVPDWLQQASDCPWNSRSEFLADQKSTRMKQLRDFLVRTINLQTQFMVDRLEHALDKMLAETAPAKRDRVRENFQQVAGTTQGCYGLIDYVNFKGEGVLHSERYQGQGWGLLQVLEEMKPGTHEPVAEFSRSAATVLKRRVHNSPPERNESRWLPGWIHRVNGYSRD